MGIVEEAHNLRVIGRADGGRGTIVLAHGFGTDQSVWKHLVPHLVEEYRVVLFDNMGAGTTNPDYFDFDRYTTLEGYALDLLAILEELRLGPCIFVGHSVSAAIGAIASISRPDLFSKLVMLSASPRCACAPYRIFTFFILVGSLFLRNHTLYLIDITAKSLGGTYDGGGRRLLSN